MAARRFEVAAELPREPRPTVRVRARLALDRVDYHLIDVTGRSARRPSRATPRTVTSGRRPIRGFAAPLGDDAVRLRREDPLQVEGGKPEEPAPTDQHRDEQVAAIRS